MIRLQNAGLMAGKKALLADVDIDIPAGEMVAIIGANGAGKSSLLRILAGDADYSGSAQLNQREINDYKPAELAQYRAVLPQRDLLNAPLKVMDVLRMGLIPAESWLRRSEAQPVVEQQIEELNLGGLVDENYLHLSGGERARVRFGRLVLQLRCAQLAQQRNITPQGDLLALLDEPLAALDLRYQRLMVEAMRALVAPGVTVVAVIHDLNWLSRFFDRVLVVDQGRLVADGIPDGVLQSENLSEWFGTNLIVRSQNIAGDEAFTVLA